jgi:hypothetical protein
MENELERTNQTGVPVFVPKTLVRKTRFLL